MLSEHIYSFLITFSSVGVITSLFLGVQFQVKGSREKYQPNYFLALFFLLIAVRLSTQLFQELSGEPEIGVVFNLENASYLALGPITWLYVRSYLMLNGITSKAIYLHFIPSVIFLFIASIVKQVFGEETWHIFYWAIQLHPLFYVFVSFKILGINKTVIQKLTRNQILWLYWLISFVSVIIVLNFFYFMCFFPYYVGITSLLITTTYLILFLAFNNRLNVLSGKSDQKYKNLNLSNEEITAIWAELRDLLLGEELFLNAQLKLADVSNRLGQPSHVISMVINTQSGKSFNDFINRLRIEKAQTKIRKEKDRKIIAIAMESGFSSLSAFNKAFKKNTGINPSEYRSKNKKRVVGL